MRRPSAYGMVAPAFQLLSLLQWRNHCGRHMSDMRKRPAQRQQGEPFEQQDQEDVKTEPAVRESGRTSRFSCTHARMHALHPLRQGKKGQLTVSHGPYDIPRRSVRTAGDFFCPPSPISHPGHCSSKRPRGPCRFGTRTGPQLTMTMTRVLRKGLTQS